LAGLKLWQSDFRAYGLYRAIARAGLAEIAYESNEVRDARDKFGESMYFAEHIEGWFELYASLYELGMMLHWHAGQIDEIEALLERGSAIARVGKLLRRFFAILRLRFVLLKGHLDQAHDVLKNLNTIEDWLSPSRQDIFAYREWDLLGVCLCHVAIRGNSIEDARKYINLLDHEAKRTGRSRTAIKAQMFRAALDLQMGNSREASYSAISALKLAHPLNLRRVFLDEAPLIEPVLDMVANAPPTAILPAVAAYAKDLAEAAKGKGVQSVGKTTSLSPREQDVVRELSSGHSNKLIARKLGLSSRTVKFHVTNVFRKLDVRKRAAAVAEAHKRGWLT
jgi:LuxR family maltose regulon positive regulatory protein